MKSVRIVSNSSSKIESMFFLNYRHKNFFSILGLSSRYANKIKFSILFYFVIVHGFDLIFVLICFSRI